MPLWQQTPNECQLCIFCFDTQNVEGSVQKGEHAYPHHFNCRQNPNHSKRVSK